MNAQRKLDEPDRAALVNRIAKLESEVAGLKDALAQATGYAPEPDEHLRRTNAELAASRRALRDSEQRLRTILDSVTEYAIISTDDRGRITGWNAGARNILGWEADEILGREIGTIFTPEDRAHGMPEREMSEARSRGRAEDERWCLRRDGERFLARGMVMPLGDDEVRGFLKILRDRTQERRAEEAVKAAERRATDIIESISDAFIALDRDYRITYQNLRGEQLTGQPLDAIRGKRVWEQWPAMIGTASEAACRRTMEGRVPTEVVERFGDDRNHIWVEIRYHPTPEGLGSFFRDITERKHAEEALEASHGRMAKILESIGDGFYAVDQDWRFTYVNRRAEQWWGRRREELLGKVVWEEFPQSVGTAPYEANLQAARERHSVHVEALSGITGMWQEMDIYPGETGLSVYFRDITERKRAEEALHRAKKEAEQANKSKSRFLAAASHDLRQPMQSLLLFLDVLKPHVMPGGCEALKHLGRGLDAMGDLLDSLLDISRLDTGVVQPSVRDFPIGDLVEQIGGACLPVAVAKGLTFRVDSCQVVVRSDRTLLGRMVRNLVENALRYTEAGEISIGCREGPDHLLIEVRDTGIGIPPEHLERIWEEFHQVENAERDRNRGTGLGLSIVQRLSSLLEHRIDVTSVLGKGSVFSIEVPLGEATAVSDAPTTAGGGGKGRFAVLVDDDAIVLLGLKATFEGWGYEVLAAGSADQALERLMEMGRRPDLVVADYRLREGRSGTEAILRLREACGIEVPGIILTGETGMEIMHEAQAHGLDVIHKPVTPRQLGEVLDRVLAPM